MPFANPSITSAWTWTFKFIGMSVHALIASPLARGLFQRAIVQSGGSSLGGGMTMGGRGLADAEAAGVKFAESKGAKSLADLRAMTWEKIVEPAPAGARGPAPCS